jgi:hypothetical protein
MKYFIVCSFLMLLLFSSGSYTIAQPSGGNAVVIQNSEGALPENGSVAEFDSLTQLFKTQVWDKNPYVVSHMIIRHWWGNNNRDVIDIAVIKTWEDIPKAMEKNNELFMEAWSTKEARDAFNKAYDKYFTGKHSDEIYQEVVFKK